VDISSRTTRVDDSSSTRVEERPREIASSDRERNRSRYRCIQGKPDSSLSTTERACIHTVVGKYLDTSEFVIGRSAKKAQGRNAIG